MNLRIKWGLFFLFSISIFSCSAVLKVTCKKNPFQDLDSLQSTKKARNFSALKPVGWYSNQSEVGALSFSIDREKTLESNPPIIHHLDNINTKRNVAYISITNKSVRNQCKIETTLEDYLHFFISNKKRWAVNKEFNYILLKTNHSRYGKVYIVKYSYKNNSIIQKGKKPLITNIVVFLLFKDQIGYEIYYSADSNVFETYLPVLNSVVASFVIKEDSN
mgnify:FL=1|jgi:hypothetical protein